jgi:epimerase transport system membrane fusion protein
MIDDNKPLEVKTSDRGLRNIGYLIVFLIFGVFGGWAALAPIDSAAVAVGTVVVKGNHKTVQHLEGGIVKDILVRDGDRVKAGDSLVVLDNAQAEAELQILQGQMYTAKALEARLIAERDTTQSISYPSDILVADERAENAIETEDKQFSVRSQANAAEADVLTQRLGQLSAQIEGLDALIKSKQSRVRSYAVDIRDNKVLLAEGFVDNRRLKDMQRFREELVGEVAEHKSAIASTRIRIGETKLQILQLHKNFQAEVVNQLSEVQARVFDVKERITAVTDRVSRTHIVAPVSGMVLSMQLHTLGGVINPGSPILSIVPQGGELLVEAQVSPNDIDRVTQGLLADIRFSAFKSGITPVIEGRVITLSADSILNESTGASYYLARVEITAKGVKDLEKLQLLPGMPAEVLINTGARTLLEYLIQPASDAVARSLIED